jgi:hypothetical protein
MQLNDGEYLPADIGKGRHFFFAIDNVNFSEDTPDGKRTLHGTAMSRYQSCHPRDKEPYLLIGEDAPTTRCIHELPSSITELLDCPEPPSKPPSTIYPTFSVRAISILTFTILAFGSTI